MPYSPNLGTQEDNQTTTPQIGVSTSTAQGPTVVSPDQSQTAQDGAATLKDAAVLVVVAIALLWGAVIGLKL